LFYRNRLWKYAKLCLIGMLCVQSANAINYHKICEMSTSPLDPINAENDLIIQYIDLDTIQKDGDSVTVWVKTVVPHGYLGMSKKNNQTNTQQEQSEQPYMFKRLYRFNCDSKKYTCMRQTGVMENNNPYDLGAPKGGSCDDAVLQFVCSSKR
jgi:hypothetical protein